MTSFFHMLFPQYHFLKKGNENIQIQNVNCFNKLVFLVKVSTELQKICFFIQFWDHNAGTKHENWRNYLIFSFSFWYLKVVKIYFHVVRPLVHSGLKNSSILSIICMWSLFCSVRVYISLHFLPILLENQYFFFLYFRFYVSMSPVFSFYSFVLYV